MIKKFLFVGIAFCAGLAGSGFCQEYLSGGQNSPSTEESVAECTAQSNVTLDRSGMDRASVHLQILQQSNNHFEEISSGKKSASSFKRSTNKPQGNS